MKSLNQSDQPLTSSFRYDKRIWTHTNIVLFFSVFLVIKVFKKMNRPKQNEISLPV